MTSQTHPPEGFQCPNLERCSFFQEHQDTMPDLVKKLKSKYCLSDNSQCARLLVSRQLGREKVPVLLMPHQLDWAKQLLYDAGKIDILE